MKRTRTIMALCAIMALLSGCGLFGGKHHVAAIAEKPVIVYVDHPVACPPAAERERLRALRPAPLRTTPMPGTVVERDGLAQAQLGKYEAEGGYADQVDSALDRCQQK